MIAVLITGLLTVLIAYVIYVLLRTSTDELSETSFDAFVIESDSSTPKVQKQKDLYSRTYDKPGKQILILYGTEYGFSEEIAKKLFDKIELVTSKDDEFPWQPRVVNVKYHEDIDFSREHLVFVVISTAGDGIPPTEARPFYNMLMETDQDAGHLSHSILALGDSNYPHFCRTGRKVHTRFMELRSKEIVPRHDVDMEDWEVINSWFDKVLACLDMVHVEPNLDYLVIADKDEGESGPSRNKPFMSKLLVKRNLTNVVKGDDKETIHCEFDLQDSGITWTSGDALGIYPENNPSEVDLLLQAMGVAGNEMVDVPKWVPDPKPDTDIITLRDALMKYYDLKTVRPEILQLLHKISENRTFNEELANLLKDGVSRRNTFLHEYLYEREVADVLVDFNEVSSELSVNDILKQMKALQPRYYSIASSPVQTTEKCCVTAAIVRYSSLGKDRTGVTTTYLQDRLQVNQCCPVFISQNPEFRLPEDGDVPVIMVGPGTGIAPFMAFINERIVKGTKGENLFYFGCRHRDGDFLYKEELESWDNDGKIKLRTAFSRDQPQKIYVQHLLSEDEDIIYKLIKEGGAHIYICGDAKHMAHDVHKALVSIMMSKESLSEMDAEKMLTNLETCGRYQKDVWVT